MGPSVLAKQPKPPHTPTHTPSTQASQPSSSGVKTVVLRWPPVRWSPSKSGKVVKVRKGPSSQVRELENPVPPSEEESAKLYPILPSFVCQSESNASKSLEKIKALRFLAPPIIPLDWKHPRRLGKNSLITGSTHYPP